MDGNICNTKSEHGYIHMGDIQYTVYRYIDIYSRYIDIDRYISLFVGWLLSCLKSLKGKSVFYCPVTVKLLHFIPRLDCTCHDRFKHIYKEKLQQLQSQKCLKLILPPRVVSSVSVHFENQLSSCNISTYVSSRFSKINVTCG